MKNTYEQNKQWSAQFSRYLQIKSGQLFSPFNAIFDEEKIEFLVNIKNTWYPLLNQLIN